MINLLKYIRGYLIVKVTGFSPERFLNLCSNKNILIWNLKREKDGFIFKISIKGFKMLRPIVRKTKTKVIIINKVGLPFFFYKYRKRKIFFGGILLFASIIYTLSLFIWDINIEGCYTYTQDMLIKYINANNIKASTLKSKINCSELEELLLFEFEEIAWVSAEIKGTRLLIKLTETAENPSMVKESEPCNIVADKDGIINSIVTRKGTPQVIKGDVVKKGDLLVSGEVPIIKDEVLTNTRFIHSDADIYAKTIYNYSDEVKINYVEKQYTNKHKKAYAISFFNKKLTVFQPRIKYDKYDRIVSSKQLKIGDSFYLPFNMEHMEYKEYELINKKYSEEEAKNIVTERMNKYIEELIEKRVQIVENNVKIQLDNKSCKAEGMIIVIEKIGVKENIENYDWRSINNDESNGDNN